MGYERVLVMGDDGVFDESSAKHTLSEKQMGEKFNDYGHEYQGGKEFCSRRILAPGELKTKGPKIPITIDVDGQKVEGVNVSEMFDDPDLKFCTNVNPEKSVMNMVANITTMEEALLSASRNFACDPAPFIEAWEKADPELAKQQSHNFLYNCAQSLAQRVLQEPRRSAELVEHTE